MMHHIESEIQKPEFTGSKLTSGSKTYIVKLGDNYSYVDPIDGSQADKQVLYISINLSTNISIKIISINSI